MIVRLPLSGDGKIALILEAPDEWEAIEGSHTMMLATGAMARALRTMMEKNRTYGEAWREQGWMGNLARIMSKTARLKNMLWRDFHMDGGEEPFTDTLQDLINLCVFMILNRQAGNRWGIKASSE